MRSILILSGLLAFAGSPTLADGPIRVVVWDEQQPQQKESYENYLGNEIAAYLRAQPGIEVTSVRLDDPERGLTERALEECDILIWWGHVRNREVPTEVGRAIVERIARGDLSLIALHSAHWSTPFVEAMNERSRRDALASLPESERAMAKLIELPPEPPLYQAPKRDDPRTPTWKTSTQPDGRVVVTLTRPNCCFPAYRGDGKPSHVRTVSPDHPIARGIPETFEIPATEMYDEPFHVPPPDEVIFEERWEGGEHFRSGMVWKIGEGAVFYFRPGHETYPIYTQRDVLKILHNAVCWLGDRSAAETNPDRGER